MIACVFLISQRARASRLQNLCRRLSWVSNGFRHQIRRTFQMGLRRADEGTDCGGKKIRIQRLAAEGKFS